MKELIPFTVYLGLTFQFLALFMIIIGEFLCHIFYNILAMFFLIIYILRTLTIKKLRIKILEEKEV